mmetsp:Transcript_125219/g.221984  ORF Transcript_125219/g.221984 Transcript_125219/m.221984 type:complete len:279 (-) Transcript_125219:856-1692(-)
MSFASRAASLEHINSRCSSFLSLASAALSLFSMLAPSVSPSSFGAGCNWRSIAATDLLRFVPASPEIPTAALAELSPSKVPIATFPASASVATSIAAADTLACSGSSTVAGAGGAALRVNAATQKLREGCSFPVSAASGADASPPFAGSSAFTTTSCLRNLRFFFALPSARLLFVACLIGSLAASSVLFSATSAVDVPEAMSAASIATSTTSPARLPSCSLMLETSFPVVAVAVFSSKSIVVVFVAAERLNAVHKLACDACSSTLICSFLVRFDTWLS